MKQAQKHVVRSANDRRRLVPRDVSAQETQDDPAPTIRDDPYAPVLRVRVGSNVRAARGRGGVR